MISTPAEVTKTLLSQLALAGGTTGWNLSLSRMPATPDKAVSVHDTSSVLEGTIVLKDLAQTRVEHKHPGIMVRVRAKDYRTGWLKAEEIRDRLNQVAHETISVNTRTYLIHCFILQGDVFPVGQEETEKREVFTVNFLMTLTEQ